MTSSAVLVAEKQRLLLGGGGSVVRARLRTRLMCPPQQQWEPTGDKHTNPGTHVCHLRVRIKHVFVSTGFSSLAPAQISETLPERCFQPPSPMIPKPKSCILLRTYVSKKERQKRTPPTTLTGSTTTRGSGECFQPMNSTKNQKCTKCHRRKQQRQQEQNRNNNNNNNK